MKKGTGLFLGALLLGGIGTGIYLATTAQTLKNLSYKSLYIKRIKSGTLADKLKETKLLLTVEITNPNKKDVTFKSFIADVISNGKVVGKINFVQSLTIPKQDKAVIKDIPFTIQNLDALKSLLDLATGKGNAILTIKGQLSALGLNNLPVNTSFDLAKLPQ